MRGYITDLISGAAIDTAVVTINSDTIVTGRTNSGGYFEFENVQLGAFELSVDGVDYVHYQGWVTVYPGDNQIDVDLSPDHGSLVGYISDFSSGLMLDSVLVIINNTDSTYTDVLGYYSIDTPVGSQNSLHTEKTGFNDFDQWVEMSATGRTLDVEMVPSN